MGLLCLAEPRPGRIYESNCVNIVCHVQVRLTLGSFHYLGTNASLNNHVLPPDDTTENVTRGAELARREEV